MIRRAGLQLGEDVGDVGFVEGREGEILLAEVVSDGLRECHFGSQTTF